MTGLQPVYRSTHKVTSKRKLTTVSELAIACSHCRTRKIRCSGDRPRCDRCIYANKECVYIPGMKRGRKPGTTRSAGVHPPPQSTSEGHAKRHFPWNSIPDPLRRIEDTSPQYPSSSLPPHSQVVPGEIPVDNHESSTSSIDTEMTSRERIVLHEPALEARSTEVLEDNQAHLDNAILGNMIPVYDRAFPVQESAKPSPCYPGRTECISIFLTRFLPSYGFVDPHVLTRADPDSNLVDGVCSIVLVSLFGGAAAEIHAARLRDMITATEEFDKTPTSVAILLLMALYEGSCLREGKGWQLLFRACNIALHIPLPSDMDPCDPEFAQKGRYPYCNQPLGAEGIPVDGAAPSTPLSPTMWDFYSSPYDRAFGSTIQRGGAMPSASDSTLPFHPSIAPMEEEDQGPRSADGWSVAWQCAMWRFIVILDAQWGITTARPTCIPSFWRIPDPLALLGSDILSDDPNPHRRYFDTTTSIDPVHPSTSPPATGLSPPLLSDPIRGSPRYSGYMNSPIEPCHYDPPHDTSLETLAPPWSMSPRALWVYPGVHRAGDGVSVFNTPPSGMEFEKAERAYYVEGGSDVVKGRDPWSRFIMDGVYLIHRSSKYVNGKVHDEDTYRVLRHAFDVWKRYAPPPPAPPPGTLAKGDPCHHPTAWEEAARIPTHTKMAHAIWLCIYSMSSCLDRFHYLSSLENPHDGPFYALSGEEGERVKAAAMSESRKCLRMILSTDIRASGVNLLGVMPTNLFLMAKDTQERKVDPEDLYRRMHRSVYECAKRGAATTRATYVVATLLGNLPVEELNRRKYKMPLGSDGEEAMSLLLQADSPSWLPSLFMDWT